MKIGNVATLVAEGVTFNGDIELKGQLIVAGNVNGAIKADEETAVVTVAETGCIKIIKSPCFVLEGFVARKHPP